MGIARFELTQLEPTQTYIFQLIDEDGSTLLKSQLREQKPMCLNEITWIRSTALKDNLYERLGDEQSEAGWTFKLHAPDAHIMGLGPSFPTESLREHCIQRIKEVVSEAKLDDHTPDIDLTTRIHGELQELAREAVANNELRTSHAG